MSHFRVSMHRNFRWNQEMVHPTPSFVSDKLIDFTENIYTKKQRHGFTSRVCSVKVTTNSMK